MGCQAPTPEGGGQGGRRLKSCSNAFLPPGAPLLAGPPLLEGCGGWSGRASPSHTLNIGGRIHPNLGEGATIRLILANDMQAAIGALGTQMGGGALASFTAWVFWPVFSLSGSTQPFAPRFWRWTSYCALRGRSSLASRL